MWADSRRTPAPSTFPCSPACSPFIHHPASGLVARPDIGPAPLLSLALLRPPAPRGSLAEGLAGRQARHGPPAAQGPGGGPNEEGPRSGCGPGGLPEGCKDHRQCQQGPRQRLANMRRPLPPCAAAEKKRDDSLSPSSGSDSEEEFSDEQEDEEDYRRGERRAAACALSNDRLLP